MTRKKPPARKKHYKAGYTVLQANFPHGFKLYLIISLAFHTTLQANFIRCRQISSDLI
jgi:hypothetical protein